MDVPNSDGHTPVFAAVTHCRLDCLRELSVLGADLSRRDLAAGNTPAMVAASHGQTPCFRYLVDKAGRRVLLDRNNDGLSAACFAVLCGRDETVAAIAEIDPAFFLDPDPRGRSTSHYAAAEDRVNCLRIMANACAISGMAAEAVERASASVADLCNKRSPDKQQHPFMACLDKQGESPLHVAARAGHLRAFAYLVNEVGLRPEDVNARGETCLWLVAANNRVS